jgi:predicted outer membrane protein
MRSSGIRCMVAGVITIVVMGCSQEQPTPAEQPGARPGAVGAGGAGVNVRSDQEFMHDVALKNMAEIELSRLALDTAENPVIKAFAEKLIDDHSAAGTKLKMVLAGTPIEWPNQLDEKHRETASELAQKRRGDFDRDYVKAMIEGHQDLAAKLESRLDVQSLADWKTAAAGRTQSTAMPEPGVAMRDVPVRPDKSGSESTMKINQWAADTYPIAQKHLDTARTIESVLKKGPTD